MKSIFSSIALLKYSSLRAKNTLQWNNENMLHKKMSWSKDAQVMMLYNVAALLMLDYICMHRPDLR